MKKFLAVIGYSSGQDGVVLLARNYCVPREKFQYNKSFIDQTCSVKISGYWPRSFFVILWTSTLSRSINIQKKTNESISSRLDLKLGQTYIYYDLLWMINNSLSSPRVTRIVNGVDKRVIYQTHNTKKEN